MVVAAAIGYIAYALMGGAAVLLISSEMPEVIGLSDRLIVAGDEAAVVAALFAPGFYVLVSGESWAWYGSPSVALAVTVMSLLLLWRHRGNISRLIAGQEGKIGSKK